MLYDYFKQLFAQVTNPPIDSIREEVIMSLECYVGPERNLLATTEQHAHRLLLPHPILTNEELAALKHLDHRGWKTQADRHHLGRERRRGGPDAGARPHLPRGRAGDRRRLFAGRAVRPRRIGAERVPVSSLLAVRRGASSPDSPGEADADRHRPRNGRSPRGASSLPARRLRGRRDQSVPGVRSRSGRRSATACCRPTTATRRSSTPITRRWPRACSR